MASKQQYDQRVLKLFDGYVHGKISRRQFLDGTAKLSSDRTTPFFTRRLELGE